jgi:hypothetical protein
MGQVLSRRRAEREDNTAPFVRFYVVLLFASSSLQQGPCQPHLPPVSVIYKLFHSEFPRALSFFATPVSKALSLLLE